MTNRNSENPDEMFSLHGQRALVTGASGNIGRGIALRLADAGAEVLVHFCTDADGNTESDCRPQRITAADPIPDLKAVITIDTKTIHRRSVH